VRRLFWLGVVAAVAWWFIGRRRSGEEVSATIGYADGSAVTLEAGSPELDRILRIASGARAT
jgi:hypothetical protein